MKQLTKLKIRETIDLLIEFIYLATIFLVPLYFSIWFPTYNVFELGKLFVFKVLVWILLFLTSAKLIFYHPKDNIKFKKYLLIPFIFIIGLGVSLYFSGDVAQSFFGSYDRQAGYLSYLFYFVWFLLLVFNIRNVNNQFTKKDPMDNDNQGDNLPRNINRVIVAASLSGLIVSVYGILQILGIDFLTWPENPLFTLRTFSTLGQPNFLASWLLLVIPLSAYLIYKNKKFLVRFFYALVLLAQLVCLFFTSSRGAMVAFCLTTLLALGYLIFFIKVKKVYKVLASSGILLAIILSFWGLNYLSSGRVSKLINLSDGSSAMRINFYSAAVDAIAQKPLFGYGLENEGGVFIGYYQTDWGIYSDVAATTDRAHNLILDIILTTGFFGLILYLILYYHFFRLAAKNITQKKMSHLSLALLFGLTAYLLSLLFSFSFVDGEIYLWLFFALIIIINIDSEAKIFEVKYEKIKIFLRQVKILVFVLISTLVIWGINYEFRVIEADHYFNALYYTLAEKQYFTTLTLVGYAEGEVTNSVNQTYYNRFLGDKLSDFYSDINDTLVKRLVLYKLNKLDKSLAVGFYEDNYVKAKINSAAGNYQEAEKYFNEVIAKTPYWPKTYIYLGPLLIKEKKIKPAIINYQLLLKILPDVNDSRLNAAHKNILQSYRKIIFQNLGDIYFSLQNYPEAEKNYQAAYLEDVNDFTLFKKIADTYYLRGNLIKAIEYNKRGMVRSPLDYNWPLAIASIYKQEGNKTEASLYFSVALKLSPGNGQLLKLKADYIK